MARLRGLLVGDSLEDGRTRSGVLGAVNVSRALAAHQREPRRRTCSSAVRQHSIGNTAIVTGGEFAYVARATGISRNQLTRLYHDQARRVELGDLEKLCSYFECGLDELFELVPGQEPEKPVSQRQTSPLV